MFEVEQALTELVAFPTISNRPVEGLSAWLAERFESLGCSIERFESTEPGKHNLCCRIGPKGQGGILLSGHMDVVPVEGQPWSSDPFRLVRRGDNLHGRGSCDMKAFLAACLSGLERVDRSRLKREVFLAFTYDEEIGCLGSRQLSDHWLQSQEKLPDLCLIGEPTSFQMLRMHPGHVAVQIDCMGQAAHSSKPDLGRNAIHKAAKVIEKLELLAADWRKDIRFSDLLERPFVVMNVATIQGGVAVNVVPDRCRIEVGFRPLPGMLAESLFAEMKERVEAIGDVRATLQRITPSMHTPEGGMLQQLLQRWATSSRTGAAAFATDGGNFEKLSMQTLIFGPGSIDVAHKADEFVPASELHKAVDVVEGVIQSLCL